MPDWAKDFAGQAPLVVIFAYVVIRILMMVFKFLEGQGTAQEAARAEDREDRKTVIRENRDSCHEHTRELVDDCKGVVEKNITVQEATTRVMTRVEKVLDKIQNGGGS